MNNSTPTTSGTGTDRIVRADAFLKSGQPADALTILRDAPADEPQWLALWANTLATLGRHDEAIAPLCRLLEIDPANQPASELLSSIRHSLSAPPASNPDRSWNTSLPRPVLNSIQNALHRYTYAGIPMLKDPFDLAIYCNLLHKLKPGLIVELGSKSGASALWFAHQCDAFELETSILSIDVIGVTEVDHPRIKFLQADARHLDKTLDHKELVEYPRPWLIIDDADHAYETCSAIASFFNPLLKPGDYLVVEDGIISDLSPQDYPDATSGPHRLIRELLSDQQSLYQVDPAYCDMFGYNMTWCTNGFLRRVR